MLLQRPGELEEPIFFWDRGVVFGFLKGGREGGRRGGCRGKVAVVVKPVLGSHVGWWVNSPLVLEPILVEIGMFTGGTGF